MNFPRKSFLETKIVCYSTLVIIVLVIVSVWLSGKDSHRSLFQNSILSTSIIAGAFFLFISFGLYYGLKLKDNVGSIFHKERIKKAYPDKMPSFEGGDFDLPDVGGGDEGCLGVIVAIILWFLAAIIIAFALYFLGFIFWVAVLFLAAMLYWIFFRALRLVFKNSRQCKGNLLKSIGFGLFYSFLYVSWIYGVIFLANYIG
ncbi:p-aminobenzoyl-glutamate transporter AbgT [Chryseobacterium defluvii]|uniref:p-aminobenzoyl-glutamate transporter AbgT n=1 Tax=Chryseobacterium defluvii TaxID=160396 RepID=A0A840KC33_9FLAO|nr:hypothetical protein [Chryseobacterium defluvii]MBB4805567.1 p-aminobenzoyl-glutamate transporter AbgT [Chryseobacterium defluvii]